MRSPMSKWLISLGMVLGAIASDGFCEDRDSWTRDQPTENSASKDSSDPWSRNGASWEKVEVNPKPATTPIHESREVTVQFKRIVKVIVYTRGFCAECDKVIDLLRTHELLFEERSVASLPGLISSATRGVRAPTVELYYSDGTMRRVIGYDEKILMGLIDRPADHDSFNVGTP
jgi:hypothetical protein